MPRIQPKVSAALAVLAAFALGVVLPTAFGSAQDEQPVVRTALAQSQQLQGAPDRSMVLARFLVRPGAELPPHRHRGTQIARIAAGTLTYTVRTGVVVVRAGDAEAAPRVVRRIRAGQTARVRPGQWLVEQPGAIHEAANRGAEPVVIYAATLLERGAPPASPVAPPR